MKIRVLMMALTLMAFAIPGWCASDAAAGFATLKGLTGQWEGKVEGQTQTITWKLVSAGSVMMEESPHESMVTMYHMDDNRLLMTHYCAAQNQPRMAAEVSADGKTIAFNFVDGTNLSKTSGHMKSMVLTLQDQNHITEKWTFVQEGKEKTELFELTRKQ